jgi:hypothetical protein
LKKKLIFLLTILLLNIACKDKTDVDPPENLIDEATYIDLYVELHLFNALVEAVDSVINQDSLKFKLFEKYATKESDFRASHSYYQSQTQTQQVRLDTASARLSRTLEAINQTQSLTPNPLKRNNQASRLMN